MNPRIRRHGASLFLGYGPMEATYALLVPVARVSAAQGLSPNLFSWGCLGFGFASGVAAANGVLSLAGVLSIAAGCCDALDGMVARLTGVASDGGEVFDAAADRYSEFFFLAGLTIWYRSSVASMILTLMALIGSLMVSYSQAKSDAMRVAVPSYWMRRPERVAYLGIAALLSPVTSGYLMLVALAVVAILTNITVVRRCVFLYSTLSAPMRDLRAGSLVLSPGTDASRRPEREEMSSDPGAP
jgi:phosphatidylglycerophosphate synthase